jgi:hypothetical protein
MLALGSVLWDGMVKLPDLPFDCGEFPMIDDGSKLAAH